MTGARPLRRFVVCAVLAIVGCAVALAGVQAPWETFVTRGARVQIDDGSFAFPDERDVNSGGETADGSALPVVAVTGLVAAIGSLLVGPRARVPLLAWVGASQAWLVVAGFTPPPLYDLPADTSVVLGPGRWIAGAGGLAGLAGAAGGLTVAHRVPGLRMPESAPADASD